MSKDTEAMGDLSEVQRRYGEDVAFREVADLLYGGGSDLVYKMNPDQTSVHVNGAKDHRNRKITAGLSAVGATAGAAGLAYGGKDMIHAIKAGTKIPKATKALVPLEIAGLGGEVMSTKILHNDTKKPKNFKPVKKAFGKGSFRQMKQNVNGAAAHASVAAQKAGNAADETAKTMKTARRGIRGVVAAGAVGAGAGGYQVGSKVRDKLHKSADLDIRWEGEISKVNDDKQQVFGWASIVEVNGQPVVDLQGDYISIDEVEKAGYDYVVKSRKGGDMHLRDGEVPVHASDMIESFIVTPEKKQVMGLPDSTPVGWWVGYQVNDPDVWAKVKSGQRTGFSIHGRGVRSEM